jgi:hypothetical protein
LTDAKLIQEQFQELRALKQIQEEEVKKLHRLQAKEKEKLKMKFDKMKKDVQAVTDLAIAQRKKDKKSKQGKNLDFCFLP